MNTEFLRNFFKNVTPEMNAESSRIAKEITAATYAAVPLEPLEPKNAEQLKAEYLRIKAKSQQDLIDLNSGRPARRADPNVYFFAFMLLALGFAGGLLASMFLPIIFPN